MLLLQTSSPLGTPNSSQTSSTSTLDKAGNYSDGGNSSSESDSTFSAKVSDFGATSSIEDDKNFSQLSPQFQGSASASGSDIISRDDLSSIGSKSGSSISATESSLTSIQSAGYEPVSPPSGLANLGIFLTQDRIGLGDSDTRQQKLTTIVPSQEDGAGTDSRPGLIQAAKSGDIDLAKKLLEERGRNLNVRDSNGRTALNIACSFGRLEMIQMFIEAGMDVDMCSNMGQTPLHEACRGGHYEILRELITKVSDLDAVDSNGLSAAHYCALNGETDCLDLLGEQVHICTCTCHCTHQHTNEYMSC